MQYFPIFLELRHRDVLIVGGGSVATRKADPLIAAGAIVTIVAPDLSSELEAKRAAGAVRHLAREFVEPDVQAKWLVVAATGSRETNARVANACLDARIPCNVVDSPELCSFIMPAIVDRSPVQIAISTGGTSPVLARLIRERIESLLDESLGAIAKFADRWRSAARSLLPSGGARREFLSWLLTGPAAQAVRARRPADADRLATAELDRRASASIRSPLGRVTLVGAGPGDPGLLTLKGLRALQEADVIVHDRLVSAEVLALARRDAARIDVGKLVGGGGASQDEINRLLVEHARLGQHVVRLKGGDPFIFGRGGEELDHLIDQGITFEVIPGISAAIAAGAYSGIPLTDRRHAQSVRFLTGNSDAALASFDYSDLAAGRETLALYMGVGRLQALQQVLIAAGVAHEMPVAFIENASRGEQRVVLAAVGTLAASAARHEIVAPSIILIGSVAASAKTHQWHAHPTLTDSEPAPGIRLLA